MGQIVAPAIDMLTSKNENWEQDLRTLKKNWNSYGGKPITEEALVGMNKLLELLDTPGWVVPLSGGGLQIEWHANGLDIEIGISPTGQPELE